MRILCVLLFAGLVQAQPNITGGPVNAASFASAGLPNTNIAQGSMFVLFGQNIGPSTQANASSFPLPSKLGGTSISATVGGTAVDAIMLYANSFQVAAILPSTVPVGTGTVTLTYNGQASNTVPIQVVASTMGIFTRNQAGTGPGVLFNFNSQADQPVNSLVTAAHPGQVLTLWGTGLGKVSGQEADGPLPGNLDVPVNVYVGNQQVTPTYKGRSGCCAGIDQVVFTVPSGVSGCYVSVAVQAGGVISNTATIAVTGSGTVCTEPASLEAADLQKVASGGSLSTGDIGLVRDHYNFSLPSGQLTGNLDEAVGHFRQYISSSDVLESTRGSVAGLSVLDFASLGSCIVSPYSYQGPLAAVFGGAGDPANFNGLDAGADLNVNGPEGATQLPRQNQGSAAQPFYVYKVTGGIIGGGIEGFTNVLPDYLDPGNYTVDDGSGGSQVGAFSAKFSIPSSPPVWTNEDAFSDISRSKDLTVTWSGGAAGGLVGVSGSSANPTAGIGATFQCLVPADAGTFTVPQWVLSALPASAVDSSVGIPIGFLSLVTPLPQPVRFSATGLDVGFLNWGQIETKNVVFQ